MGQIVATYDLMPESIEVDLEIIIKNIAEAMPNGVKLLETKIEPVAFGLKKINAGFIINDEEDNIGDELEKALLSIPGIENIECVSTTVY